MRSDYSWAARARAERRAGATGRLRLLACRRVRRRHLHPDFLWTAAERSSRGPSMSIRAPNSLWLPLRNWPAGKGFDVRCPSSQRVTQGLGSCHSESERGRSSPLGYPPFTGDAIELVSKRLARRLCHAVGGPAAHQVGRALRAGACWIPGPLRGARHGGGEGLPGAGGADAGASAVPSLRSLTRFGTESPGSPNRAHGARYARLTASVTRGQKEHHAHERATLAFDRGLQQR